VRAEGSLHRAAGIAFIVAATVLALSAQALAADPPKPPPPTSAIDQYIESVPTAGGGVANGVGEQRSKRLSRRVATAIKRDGGADAATLKAITRSSTYGAPQQRLVPRRDEPGSSNALSAAAVATGSSGSHALWLLGIVLLTTVAAVTAAGLRQRAQR
jgi:hypothetical protein